MDKEELRELGKRLNDRIREAVERGDYDGALKISDGLPKDFILILKGLRLVIQDLMPLAENIFRREQAAISGKIVDALKKEDGDAVRSLLEEKEAQFLPIHDFYVETLATIFNWAYTTYGDDALFEVLKGSAESQKAGFDSWEEMSIEDFVRATAFLAKSHMGRMTVEEDEEKFTFTNDPCGSGGRMMRNGWFDRGGKFVRVNKAQPQTFGREGLPVYCAHCAVWNGIMTTEWYGHIQWAIEPPEKPDDPCRMHIYKDRDKVPERFYKALGLTKG
jgi:hypothetical protein